MAYNESGLLLFSTLVIGWVLQALMGEEQRMRSYLVGGIMAGLACGVKYTAVPTVVMFCMVTLMAMEVYARRSPKQWLGGVGAFALAALLMFSPWLARNAMWTGNPIFPMAMKVLGQGHFDDVQVERWDRAHGARPDQVAFEMRLHELRTQLVTHWQYGYVLVPTGILAMVVFIRRREMRYLAILLLLQLAFWLFFTHLAGRFAVLLIPICALGVGLSVRGRLDGLAAGAIVLSMVLGLWDLPASDAKHAGGLDTCLAKYAGDARDAGAFILRDQRLLMSPQLASMERSGKTLALIGGGQAFVYPLSHGKLIYRTVFDVRITKGKSVVDGWLGEDVESLNRRCAVLINPAELRRLTTYYGISSLPDKWKTANDRPVLLMQQK